MSIYALKYRFPSARHTYHWAPERMVYVPLKARQACRRLRETLPRPVDEGAHLYGRDLPAERYTMYVPYESSPEDPQVEGPYLHK